MIDFKSSTAFKLKPIENDDIRDEFHKFLIDGETITAAFKTIRDQLVFTNKRIISADVQGLTGKKVDYTSIPYSKIQAFSVETSGLLDPDCEIEIYIIEMGKIKFEIKGPFDPIVFNRHVSEFILA